MDPLHEKCLRKNRTFLLNNLRPRELLDYFIQEELLTIDEKNYITSKSTPRRQAEELLDKLPRCGSKAFTVFLDSLEMNGQEFIREQLQRELDELRRKADLSSAPGGPTSLFKRLFGKKNKKKKQRLSKSCNDLTSTKHGRTCPKDDDVHYQLQEPTSTSSESEVQSDNEYRLTSDVTTQNAPLPKLLAKEVQLNERKTFRGSYNFDQIGAANFNDPSSLLVAATNGCLDLVKFLVETRKVDIEVRSRYKGPGETCAVTPLYMASMMNKLDVVKFLVEKGACVNATDSNGLTCAMTACRKGHVEVVKYLVEHGADINKTDTHGETCLLYATKRLEQVRHLVKTKANVNAQESKRWTALMKTCEERTTEVMNCLVENGADVNKRNKRGQTCLMHCVRHLKMVKYLIQNNADIDIQDLRGSTVLHYATKNKLLDVVKVLLNHAPDINRQDNEGLTALHLAITVNFQNGVELLIQHGASITLQDKNGDDAVRCACLAGLQDTVAFLLSVSNPSAEKKIEVQLLLACYSIDEEHDFKTLNVCKSEDRSRNNIVSISKTSASFLESKVVNDESLLCKSDVLKGNPDKRYQLALDGREKVLGIQHPKVLHYILRRGETYGNNGEEHKCIELLMGYLTRHSNKSRTMDAQYVHVFTVLSQTLWRVKRKGAVEQLTSDKMLFLLHLACRTTERTIDTTTRRFMVQNEDVGNMMCATLHIIRLLVKSSPSQEQQIMMHNHVSDLVARKITDMNGRCLLELAKLNSSSVVNKRFISLLPCQELLSYLAAVCED